MRVLIIEDEADVAEALIDAVSAAGSPITPTLVGTRDQAFEELAASSHYDLIIVDLKIPSTRGTLDFSPDHGRAAYATARKERPGTPIWVFSGFADEDFLESIIDEARQGDPFGSGASQPMIRKFRKIHLHRIVEELVALGPQLAALEDIELSTGGIALVLEPDETRLLRIFACRFGGATAHIRSLDPGLSSSRALHVRLVDQHGAQVAESVVKIGSREDLEEEAQRYEENVPLALTATCFAPIFAVIADGVGRSVALAYTVAVPDPKSLADLLAEDEQGAIQVLDRLRECEKPWYLASRTAQLSLDAVCDLLAAPKVGSSSLDLDASRALALAAMPIQVAITPQHGDLHIANALVDATGAPVLIDYGRTGERVAAYDPVTLELCFAFHPAGRRLANGWPTPEKAARFDDKDEYLVGCPFPDFVWACRQWAHDVANGDREVWATVLSFCLRQFQYEDTSDALASAYASRASRLLFA